MAEPKVEIDRIEQVLKKHAAWHRHAPTFRGWDDVRWRCTCGENVDEDPPGVAITNRHRLHVATALVRSTSPG